LILFTAYYSAFKVGEGDSKYSLGKLAETAKVTAYDILIPDRGGCRFRLFFGRIGWVFFLHDETDPQAINVSLFRPYLWEVKNPLMLLSAIEALIFLSIHPVHSFKKNAITIEGTIYPIVLFA